MRKIFSVLFLLCLGACCSSHEMHQSPTVMKQTMKAEPAPVAVVKESPVVMPKPQLSSHSMAIPAFVLFVAALVGLPMMALQKMKKPRRR